MLTLAGIRSSGVMLIVAGILFGSFMFFHPPNNPQGALAAIGVPIHLMWLLSYLLIALSWVPLSALRPSHSFLSSIAYYLSFLGTILSLPIAVWDAFLVPYLARHAPDFIPQIEEISGEIPVLIFRMIIFLTVFEFSLGFMLYGVSALRSRLFPNIVGICLAVGAPLFWVGALVVSQGSLGNTVTEMGALLFGVGLAILGRTLLVNADQFLTQQSMWRKIQVLE
ncbi:hypothetical protein DO97_13615 [Neosynechococcus sphagnicola sy1]|uniref:Uncharacterized protein n=1 Tax=Neosynechococcus sphagnicola sy1 TaxID=1497020 RepID=A0A098TIY2_9CYAN|nr:hypothetical protein [Neosynechococcus sphagnicola]KGF72049.1 hypothetical protein DO97_13615 [Neosynechococcus sphagnicola sy1]